MVQLLLQSTKNWRFGSIFLSFTSQLGKARTKSMCFSIEVRTFICTLGGGRIELYHRLKKGSSASLKVTGFFFIRSTRCSHIPLCPSSSLMCLWSFSVYSVYRQHLWCDEIDPTWQCENKWCAWNVFSLHQALFVGLKKNTTNYLL